MNKPKTTTYTLDLESKSTQISPLWFGHNLEHTRSCVWQGLSAQLLRNRKFHGIPQRSGVADGWYPIGPSSTCFALEPRDTFTRYYDPQGWRRRKETLCQAIGNVTGSGFSGIGQGDLVLIEDHWYELRIALRSEGKVAVVVQVLDQASNESLFQDAIDVTGDQWCEFELAFTARKSNDAHLQIVFDQPGKLYVGAVSLLPKENFHGMRPDVIQRLKEIGCPLLRWPGGNFAGDYRWQDGLLPVDQRSPLSASLQIETLGHTGGYDCHEIGTDEFIALCCEVGAEPYLTINPTWEPPESTAAWVEYCNGTVETRWGAIRTARGHRQPHGVKFWSLGNEFGQSHMEGPNSPADYARHLRPHAEAMRAVDPSIELVASGNWRHDDWFTQCLPDLGDTIDHVSHHHYTGGESPARMNHYIGPPASEDFLQVATNPTKTILPELVEVREKLQVHAPTGRTFGITFDEWNVWHAWHRIPGVVEGIHNATMLNMLCREADRVGITLGCFFEPVNEGAIIVEPERAYLPAGGKVFPLFKAHYGNRLLKFDSLDPQAEIDVAASLNEQTMTLVLTVVNQDPQHSQHIRFVIQPYRLETMEGYLLSSKNFLPGSDFVESQLPWSHWMDGLEFELAKHSVVRVCAKLAS